MSKIFKPSSITEATKQLENLYSITGHDWVLECTVILTEPACPIAVIRPEGSNMLRYAVSQDTLEAAILLACDLVNCEIIQRSSIKSHAPFTNPDDKFYEEWINKRLKGSNECLPYFPEKE